jgi:hypothetical protein
MPTSEKVSRLTELIQLLNKATDRGGLQWEATLDENEFRAFLTTGLVKIMKMGDDYLISSRSVFGSSPPALETPQTERYAVQILDSTNRVIDFLVPSTPEENEPLKELFWKVRRSALQVDQLYGNLLTELRSRAGQ